MRMLQTFLILAFLAAPAFAAEESAPVAIAIHGGAGTILPEDMSAEQEAAYRAKLTEALRAGHGVLQQGGSSVDAVIAAITIMEDSPLFNAGKGAVFTAAGKNELDASIMDGASGKAGAVAGVTRVKNPIRLARLVMEASPHVMLAREGAEAFAVAQGMELVEESYFRTERRWRQLQEVQARRKQAAASEDWRLRRLLMGTVGAVALDRAGNLAAGTSTGGMTNKLWGRIGDSPIIGAGTYAENGLCAVSATGHGEFFIRNVVAYDICARSRYLNQPLAEAAETVINGVLVEQEADGGVIVMDGEGNIAAPFNTPGMYRGWIATDGEMHIAIYKEK